MTDKPDTARPVAIAQDANVSKQEALDQWQQQIAYTEVVYNGAVIRWRYWVEQMPQLRAAEAARLMRALDPDLFQSLDHRPNKNDPSKRCEQAAVIQRLAERQGMQVATPAEWLAWALREGFVVHDGFRLAVESQPAPEQDSATPAPVAQSLADPCAISDGVKSASNSPTKTAAVDRGWVMKRGALIRKHESQWPTIDRDFRDASDNNLSTDAKAPGYGYWFEVDALNWARQRGKYSEATVQPEASKATLFEGLKHRIKR